MGKRAIKTSIHEDLESLGLSSFNMTEQAILGGIPLNEDKDAPIDDEGVSPLDAEEVNEELFDAIMNLDFAKMKVEDIDEIVEALKEKTLSEDAPDALKARAEEVVEFLHNAKAGKDVSPLDAPEVNEDLFDAIMWLQFEKMNEDDVEELLDALKEKTIPYDASTALKERAEEVVDFLVSEAVAKKTRRAKSGSMAKKASFQCPPGTRKDPKDKSGRRCIRAAKAAGGAGKLAKASRKKGRWAKSGAGKKSSRKSGRWAARREGAESPFAIELAGLVEDVQIGNVTVRDDLLDRIGNIMEMLSEEFLDEAVTQVLSETYEPVIASWDAGRLDEDVMDEDEFISEIKPVLTLIHKSLGRLNIEGVSGN